MFYVLHSSSIFIQLTCSIPIISMYLQGRQKTMWILISWLISLFVTSGSDGGCYDKKMGSKGGLVEQKLGAMWVVKFHCLLLVHVPIFNWNSYYIS